MSCKHVCHEFIPSKNGSRQKRKNERWEEQKKKKKSLFWRISVYIRSGRHAHGNRSSPVYTLTHTRGYVASYANNDDNDNNYYPVSTHMSLYTVSERKITAGHRIISPWCAVIHKTYVSDVVPPRVRMYELRSNTRFAHVYTAIDPKRRYIHCCDHKKLSGATKTRGFPTYIYRGEFRLWTCYRFKFENKKKSKDFSYIINELRRENNYTFIIKKKKL